MALFVRKCPCLRPQIEEEVRTLDYRHCSLQDVPAEVFNFERTLEELLVDSNQIHDLPRELFYCHGIRKLSISDNEIKQIPAAIGSLISLEHLDLSKNGVIDIPENIKCCKHLQAVDASVNPLGKLPDGFTQLLNLTQLYLNDTFLDYLPGNFGRLSKLKILEIRENHLKTLPKSFSRLTELEKLDIGHNEFNELPDVIGSLSSLLELWCDHNQITSITPTIGNLKQLMFFDGCQNGLVSLPSEIEGCTSLADLHLTTNQLQTLPDSIGNLINLTTLKVDDNNLNSLPKNMGGMSSLSELNVSSNNLQELPSSLGLLRYLRTLYADDNNLDFIPAELGSCSGITVLSLRSNNLPYIPDEIGRIPQLRVLNLSSNKLQYLPFSFIKLKEIQALWLSENQTRPLIQLQSERDPETGRKYLTCYLLPQGSLQDPGDSGGDTDSFHASMWEEERRRRQQIHFDMGDDSDVDGSLIRQPTPYPKEMREKARHLQNLALRQKMSGGHDPRDDGEDNPAYEQWRVHQGSPSMERVSLGNQEELNTRMRNMGVTNKPGSPSLQDPYSLYKFDKEKLARDKARMQQRRASQTYEDDDTRSQKKPSRDNSPAASDRSHKRSKDRKSRTNEDQDDGGFGEHRVGSLGSTPDIPSATSNSRPPTGANSFTYCSPSELSHSLSNRSTGHHHHHHRSRRHRNMREYDSDTGYRSDQELMKFRRQQQQMYQRVNDNYSEIVPVMNSKGRRRDGYSSDIEVYSRRGGLSVSYNDTPLSRNEQSAHNGSLPHGINQTMSPSKSANQISDGTAVRNDELYGDPHFNHYPSSSPSPFQRRKIIDQSTPMSPTLPRPGQRDGRSDPLSRKHHRSDLGVDWKKDLFPDKEHPGQDGGFDPQNRYMPHVTMQSQGPYNTGAGDTRVTPPYKPAPPYSGPNQRKLPPTPHRTSPFGPPGQDRQHTRHTPVKDGHRMPDIQELRDSRSDLSQRSRSQMDHLNGCGNDQDQRNYMEIPSDMNQTPVSHNASVIRTPSGQGDVTSASSKDSGNYSYRERTSVGESPVNFRNSPLNSSQERRGSRNSPFDYSHDGHRNFDRYDASFREAPTVDIPTRYEDIAMFKSSEPPSQVSSSTDSGYGHGHNVFDKMLESHRFSNTSQGSPSPDQFNSDSNCTASPQRDINGQYSRGATPVNHPESLQSDAHANTLPRIDRFRVTIKKNPGLGFSIAGGAGSYGNPFRAGDMGIFVTKVQPDGPASSSLRPGDKLLEVNGLDFIDIDHRRAVSVLKNTGTTVKLFVEREAS